MNIKFLPFIVSITLFSVAANAETYEEVTADEANFGEVNVDEDLTVSGNTTLNKLSISFPRGLKNANFIECVDNNIAVYNKTFLVSQEGLIAGTGLIIKDQSADHSYSASFNISYKNEDKNFLFSTSSYPGGPNGFFYPIKFIAEQYIFDKGDMIVNSKITCKDELNVTSLSASNIKTDDININMNNAADYVFDESYNLKPLHEVEAFVKENKHLPGIPSASEMSEKGVSVSAMSNMLLEKVEELTLHMIRLEKENAELRSKMNSLKK